jgi:hypothetical protein
MAIKHDAGEVREPHHRLAVPPNQRSQGLYETIF